MAKKSKRGPAGPKIKRTAPRLGARAELHRRGMSEAEVNAALTRKGTKRIDSKRNF